MDIDPSTPKNYIVEMLLSVSDDSGNTWDSSIYYEIKGGHLDIISQSISDGNDNVFDPGETADLEITVMNNGSYDMPNVTGTLISWNGLVTVDDNTATFGDVNQASSANCAADGFTITGSTDLIPGMVVDVELVLSNDNGYYESQVVKLYIGTPTSTDPLGPDSYGYIAYGTEDVGYPDAPTYNWIEINPASGGSGTSANVTDTGHSTANGLIDHIEYHTLPFSFRYYGEDYTEIGICSNGWVTLSNGFESGNVMFRNWRIPGPGGPNPMIAPFWEDLVTSGGGIYKYYDQTENAYIVEWDNVGFECYGASTTFQILLYDPLHHASPMGDGLIKFQYQNWIDPDGNNSTSGSQGNHCTIGIEDHTGVRGLEYVYHQIYPTAAQPLNNNSAILFTSIPNIQVSTVSGHVNLDFNAYSVQNVDIMVGDILTHPDTNGDYSVPVPPGTYNVSATLPFHYSEPITDVVVLQGNVTSGIDFDLEYYMHAENLTSVVDSVNFEAAISWDFLPLANASLKTNSLNSTRNTRVSYEFFTLYRKSGDAAWVQVDTMTTQTYTAEDIFNDIEYQFYVTVDYAEGVSDSSEVLTILWTFPVNGSDENIQVFETTLQSNYPNPFNPETIISYSLTDAANVVIDIYNIRGKKVTTLVNDEVKAGQHTAVWKGRDASGNEVGSGVYFYRMKTGRYTSTKKMILLK